MEWGKRVFLLLEYQCVKEAGDSPRRREELYKFFFLCLYFSLGQRGALCNIEL